MNKFKMWHLAVICIAVFIVFAILATIAVVTNKELRNIDNWNIDGDNISFWGLSGGTEYNIDDTKTEDIDGITNIEIHSISSDITVDATPSSNASAHLYGKYATRGDKLELVVKKSGSTLNIYIDYPKRGITNSELKLDITIPGSFSGDISVSGVSSDIVLNVESIEFKEVTLNTMSGEIYTNTINAESVKASSTSGDLYAQMINGELSFTGTSSKAVVSGLSDTAYIKTVSGNVNLTLEEPYDATVKTVSGDVNIELDSTDSFYIDFSSVSGDFDCDLPLVLETNKRGNVKGYYEDSNGAEFNVSTTSGDLTIR